MTLLAQDRKAKPASRRPVAIAGPECTQPRLCGIGLGSAAPASGPSRLPVEHVGRGKLRRHAGKGRARVGAVLEIDVSHAHEAKVRVARHGRSDLVRPVEQDPQRPFRVVVEKVEARLQVLGLEAVE